MLPPPPPRKSLIARSPLTTNDVHILKEMPPPPALPRKSITKSPPTDKVHILKEMSPTPPRKSITNPPFPNPTESPTTSDGEDTIINDDQREKTVQEITDELCEFCKQTANVFKNYVFYSPT